MAEHIKVLADRYPDEYKTFKYEERSDGWYLDHGDGYERFALPEANERDAKQLIMKDWDLRY